MKRPAVFLVALSALAGGLAAAIGTLPAETVEDYQGVLFACYTILLAGSLPFLPATLVPVQALRVRRAFVLGAALGGVPNLLYWTNWFFVPVDSVLFELNARAGLVVAAPGLYIPTLWGEQMLLHHSHFSKEDSLIQWTIMTLLNSATWSALFGGVVVVVQRIRGARRAAQPVSGNSSAPGAND